LENILREEAGEGILVLEDFKETIERIREKSPILKEMENNEEINIVGGVYHLSTGKVVLL
jgi:carbonic anhydrase